MSLFMTIVLGIVAFVRIAPCPDVHETFSAVSAVPLKEVSDETLKKLVNALLGCPTCDGTGKVTFLKRWFYRGEGILHPKW
jgi:hypothetical protein